MNSEYSKMSQDDLIIKILEFVCKNKDKNVISPELIQRDLFPDVELNEILHLVSEIQRKNISQVTVIGKYKVYLQYRMGLEEYIKSLNRMTKKQKLHKIVEFLSTESERLNKGSFNSGEIAKAFVPELDIYEVNSLCEILIDNRDVGDCSSKDTHAKRMIAVLVINKTHTAYHTKKYLEEDEQISIPINQNIVTGDNVIIGDNFGKIKQENNSAVKPKSNGKPKWLKWLKWILGILVAISIITAFIISIS